MQKGTSEQQLMLKVLEVNAGQPIEMFGHIQRRNNDGVGKRMLQLEPRGRPKRRFTDAVKEYEDGLCE